LNAVLVPAEAECPGFHGAFIDTRRDSRGRTVFVIVTGAEKPAACFFDYDEAAACLRDLQ